MTRRILPRLLLCTVSVAALSGCGSHEWYSGIMGGDTASARPVSVTPGAQPTYTPPPSRVEVSNDLPPVRAARSTPPTTPMPSRPIVQAQAPAPAQPPFQQQRVAAPAAQTHRVVPGDTVYSIARRYGTTPNAIQSANALGPDFAIKIDQALSIPGGANVQTAAMSGPTAAPAPQPRRAPDLTNAPRSLSQPVDGSIVSNFGDSTGTSTNDGIDFAAEPGAPVSAAADGTVAFVSDDSGPLGSVVLMQHGGGMVSIYGRIAQATVKPGQTISAGTPIARVAAPRSGGKALLHFELRKGSQPVDPAAFF